MTSPAETQFNDLVAKAKKEDLNDVKPLNIVKNLGSDTSGIPCLMFVPCFLGLLTEKEIEKAKLHALLEISEVATGQFKILICLTRCNWASDMSLPWIRECYDLSPPSVHENIQKIYIAHGGISTRAALGTMSPFFSNCFWSKVEYVNFLSDILSTMKDVNAIHHFPLVVQREESLGKGESPLEVFATPLETLCSRTGRAVQNFKNIPEVLYLMVRAFERPEVMSTKDLFFHQSDALTIYAFIGDLDNGEPATEWSNIPVLVTAFRVFLDALPVPLLGAGAFTALRKAKDDNADPRIPKHVYIALLKKLVAGVPQVHQDVLKFLLEFLRKVTSKQRENMMTPKKVAECLAPAFLRPSVINPAIVDCINAAVECIAVLITDHASIFASNDEDSEDDDDDSDDGSDDSDDSSDDRQPKAKPGAKVGAKPKAKGTARRPSSSSEEESD